MIYKSKYYNGNDIKLFHEGEITHWEASGNKLKQSYEICSLVECTLKTGRTHQVRVHMNAINYPLILSAHLNFL